MRLEELQRVKRKKPAQKEKKLSHMVAEFLARQYPNVIFRFDVAADMKMTMYQASQIKNKLLHKRGYPDLFIAKAKGKHHGLYIELKKDRSEVFKKDGSYKKNEHIEQQVKMHKILRDEGYKVEWGLGFDDTIKKIRDYMNIGKPVENDKQAHLEDYL